MELALIDAIGPFFRGYAKRRINWSKIPFGHLATDGDARVAQWAQIQRDFHAFLAQIKPLGYNAITLDDVAHLTDHEVYEPEVRAQIAAYQEEFRPLIEMARAAGFRVFVTSDCFVTTPAADRLIGGDAAKSLAWVREMLERFLDTFPQVDGVILRIGESDGVDVRDALRSRLLIRTADEVNRMLREILPAFEVRGKRLIFRTWTVGAHLIGDLIWHRGRVAQAFRGIDSPALIVSMKTGESDFFRYLPLNRHFFRLELPTIVEFQARREYEGAGEYPSFIGWDCERFARELKAAPHLIGFSVWCQTGGWHAFRRLAFLDPESTWIELNAAVIARIFLEGATVEQAVTEFVGANRAAGALELLRRADDAILNILYIPQFATQKLFFRRVRIPPLLHVYWDSIFVNDAVRKVLQYFVHDPESAIRGGEGAFANFAEMEHLAKEIGWPVEDIRFMADTFALILLARRYYLLPFDQDLADEIRAAKQAYKAAWPRGVRQRYRIRTSFEPFHLQRRSISWLVRIFIRRRRGYRTVLDRLFTLTVLSWLYRLFRERHQAALPKVLRKSAMGVDVLFR